MNKRLLALQVFEEIIKEYLYIPQVSIYADTTVVLVGNDLFETVRLLFSYLRTKNLDLDIEGFNALLRTSMEFDISEVAMECFQLMEVAECKLGESTFRILINGFGSKAEMDLLAIVKQEAEKYFCESLEFLLVEKEE